MSSGALCQYVISHLHTDPGRGDATLEPCNLRVLSAPDHKNPGNNGAVNTVEG